MSFRKDKRGFIFSLDATLAILVVFIVMAGVARVGGPELIYGQHGYLRLERYANDALEVLYHTGTIDNEFTSTIDNIRSLLAKGKKSVAESLAENELKKILPSDVQFRLRIGPENSPRLDNVYPSAGNHATWRSAFNNAKEIAAATRVSIFHPDNAFDIITLYVWRGPPT